MPLVAGTRLGPYEILSALGAGGMGEVYRATDTNLNRQVAIKVLPASVAGDAGRLARFKREAEILAALNHPHVAAIYGLERAGAGQAETIALVMELVDGPTLADRIGDGALPLTEALSIAKQIAEALEAAHAQGIIHRDLKPANIKVRPDGTVKVLDFGLAKAMEPAGTSMADPAVSPTVTSPVITLQGVILGTAAYMSPEQAGGKTVDKRSDLWALGVVLLEMLTGRRTFTGENTAQVLAAVLTQEPDWTALPTDTPVAIRKLLRRCLEKDRKRRLADAADARLEIEDASAAPAAADTAIPAPHRRSLRPMVAVATGAALLAALVSWALNRPGPAAPAAVTRFTLAPSSALSDDGFTVAPDGSFVVYRVSPPGGEGHLVVRRFDRLEESVLPGVTNAQQPFVSPDGRWIGYVTSPFTLMKVAVSGGAPSTIARLPSVLHGASWADDDTIIAATNSGTTGLLRVSAAGGDPTVITTLDRTRSELGHWWPSVLPGGRAVLFTIVSAPPAAPQIALLDLQTNQRTVLIQGGSDAHYVASGHLVYAQGDRLSAVRFDLARRTVTGDPVSVIEDVSVNLLGEAKAAVTYSGTLVYMRRRQSDMAEGSLVWVDRKGVETPIGAPPRQYVSPRLSPDGTKVALDIRDQANDIWLWDFKMQALTRLTFDPAIERTPVWTPDGRRIVFASSRTGAFDLYVRSSDGSGTDERLTASTNPQWAAGVTPDGAFVIGGEQRPKTLFDIVRVPLNASGLSSDPGQTQAVRGMVTPEGLVETSSDERNGELSPGGRFLAYQSTESGRSEIYVRPYPQTANGRWQISTTGGVQPGWTHDGHELLYLDGSGHLTMVPVDIVGAGFQAGAPSTLLSSNSYGGKFAWRSYDVSQDGRRFLMIKDVSAGSDAEPPANLVVVEHWSEELQRLLPPN